MPSNLFEVRLEADPALLRIVSGSGVLALPLGVLVVTMIGVTAIMAACSGIGVGWSDPP